MVIAILGTTGIAAFNIKGLTIHKFLKLPIFHENNKHSAWSLNNNDIKAYRNILKNLKLIITGKIF